MDLKFPYNWDDPDLEVRLIEPWSSAASNLIRALSGGAGAVAKSQIEAVKDGRGIRKTIDRMPKGGQPVSAQDIANIAAWIDAGCPQEPGGEPAWPKPGGGGDRN